MKKITTLLLATTFSCMASYATRIWPIILDGETSNKIQNFIAGDFRVNDVDNHLYIWSSGETYALGDGVGKNFFDNNEGYLSLVVAAPAGWSGLGFCIENEASVAAMRNLKDAIVAHPDSFFLHIAMKATTQGSHQFYTFQNSATSFAIGSQTMEQGQVIGDFPRDGAWHDFYIPMSQFASAIATVDIKSGTNILCALSGNQVGAQLNLDAVYFCDLDFKKQFDEFTCKDLYNVSITAGEHGHISTSKVGSLTTCDDLRICTEATADQGYHFVEWSDGYPYMGRCIDVESDTTIVAIFAKGEKGGKVGDDLYWAYEKDLKKITISGSGEMWELNLGSFDGGYFEDWYYPLETVLIEEGATSISERAFKSNRRLLTANLPASLTCIEESSFEDCRSLQNLNIASPSSLTFIGDWAFYNCHELPALDIPEGVTYIGKAAFYGCSYMQELKLPASMQQIQDNAFAQCTQLKKITSAAIVPPAIAEKTFFEVNAQTPVYVPKGSVNDYESDPYWGRMNIIGAETALNDAFTPASTPSKQLINGQLLIFRGGKTYTIHGQEVK